MGTIVTVGSQAYNLAGDPTKRGNYLKTSVVTAVVSDVDSIGASVTDALLAGPGIKYGQFARWADKHGFNDSVGNVTGISYTNEAISAEAFAAIVPSAIGTESKLVFSDIDGLNLTYLGRQYVYANLPARRGQDFTITYERVTVVTLGVSKLVLTGDLIITFPDTTTVTFSPSQDVINANDKTFAYVEYLIRNVVAAVASTVPAWTVVTTEAALPDTTSYSGSYPDAIESVSLITAVHTLVEYSEFLYDGAYYFNDVKAYDSSGIAGPDEITDSSSSAIVSFNRKEANFTKTLYSGETSSIGFNTRTFTLRIEHYYEIVPVVTVNIVTEQLNEGITKTTTTTTTTDTLVLKYRHRETYIDTVSENWQLSQIAIYQIGTNPVTDALVNQGIEQITGKCFPVIPIRKFNTFVDKEHYPTQYALNKKAVKKAFGKNKLNSLIEGLASSEQLADLDHAWLVFGVSVSTQQPDGKEYIYQFFKALADNNTANPEYIREVAAYNAALAAYTDALNAYVAYYNSSTEYSAAVVAPTLPLPPQRQKYRFVTQTGSGNQDWAYNVVITAEGGARTLGSGYHFKANNKVGTVWVYKDGVVDLSSLEVTQTETEYGILIRVNDWQSADIIKIGKQLTDNTWEEYAFFNVVHKNIVYDGYSVTTYAGEALTDADENSGFIIPLNEVVFNNTPLVRRTQLSLECAFMQINYYVVTKTKWYQSTFFMIILIIVIIVIAVTTGYISTETMGLMGANITVGLAILGPGMGVLLTTIVGAIANAIAAAIVGALISKLSISIFGNTALAHVVAFIATVATMNWAANGFQFDMSKMVHGMSQAENLLKLTMTGVNAYSDYLSGKVGNIMGETRDLMNDHEARMKEIQELSSKFLSSTGIDPMALVDAMQYVPMEPESAFLNRTGMTGDDIVAITIGLIEDFPKQQLLLPTT